MNDRPHELNMIEQSAREKPLETLEGLANGSSIGIVTWLQATEDWDSPADLSIALIGVVQALGVLQIALGMHLGRDGSNGPGRPPRDIRRHPKFKEREAELRRRPGQRNRPGS